MKRKVHKRKVRYAVGDRVISVTDRNGMGNTGTIVQDLQDYGEIRVYFPHVQKTFWVHTIDFKKLPKG